MGFARTASRMRMRSDVRLMKIVRIIAFTFLVLLVSCRVSGVRDAVACQLEMFPESRVQDIYKSFCQDKLGPGHLVSDPEAARAYLMDELRAYREDLDSARCQKPQRRTLPVGDEGNYVRVDLSVVIDSLVSADALLEAFVRSANESKTVSTEEWKAKWASVADVIRKSFPDIPDAERDLAAIDSLMAQGHLILHHSRSYVEAYHPHYRIIARDILERDLRGL